jgi:surface antigen
MTVNSSLRTAACVVMLACAALLPVCHAQTSKQTTGTVGGALIGGLLGSAVGSGHGKTGAIIGGVVLGGIIGNVIGKHMDENDRKQMNNALESSPPGQSSTWQNADTGATYQVTPGQTYDQNGRQCRSFTQEAIIDGEPRKISGTACRKPDDSTWETTG